MRIVYLSADLSWSPFGLGGSKVDVNKYVEEWKYD